MSNHSKQQQGINVSTGDHSYHGGLERLRVIQNRRHCRSTRGLGHQFAPLGTQHKSTCDGLVIHGDNLVDEILDHRERHIPRTSHGDAISHRGH